MRNMIAAQKFGNAADRMQSDMRSMFHVALQFFGLVKEEETPAHPVKHLAIDRQFGRRSEGMNENRRRPSQFQRAERIMRLRGSRHGHKYSANALRAARRHIYNTNPPYVFA